MVVDVVVVVVLQRIRIEANKTKTKKNGRLVGRRELKRADRLAHKSPHEPNKDRRVFIYVVVVVVVAVVVVVVVVVVEVVLRCIKEWANKTHDRPLNRRAPERNGHNSCCIKRWRMWLMRAGKHRSPSLYLRRGRSRGGRGRRSGRGRGRRPATHPCMGANAR